MKISFKQLKKLIIESLINEDDENDNIEFSVYDGNLKANNFVYELSTSGIDLFLKSIEKVSNGLKVTITPPKIPFVSDGSDRTGILSGEKLDLIKSKVKSGIGSFDIIMADGTKILFTKV